MSKTDYDLRTENNRLIFSTRSFRAEKSSVLHSGVYTNEFASMLAASAMAVVAYVAADSAEGVKHVRYLWTMITFIVSFVVSRIFIFRDRNLKVEFNRDSKTVEIIRPSLFFKKTETIPFSDIKAVAVGNRKFTPVNVDGIRFVQKISLQHGSAMPELSQEEEYITIALKLMNGSERIIYAGRIEHEPELPVNEIKRFIGMQNRHQ